MLYKGYVKALKNYQSTIIPISFTFTFDKTA
jgi:hypothetical protein